MSYVINNRIPRFPIRSDYSDGDGKQARTGDAVQLWLVERYISNLTRRKVCSRLYDFSVHMHDAGLLLESVRPSDWENFVGGSALPAPVDFGEFLRFARAAIPDLDWEYYPPDAPA